MTNHITDDAQAERVWHRKDCPFCGSPDGQYSASFGNLQAAFFCKGCGINAAQPPAAPVDIPDDVRATEDMTLAMNARQAAINEMMAAPVETDAAKMCNSYLERALKAEAALAAHNGSSAATKGLKEAVRGAVARGWCSRDNEHKEMDAALAESIFIEVWAEVAAHVHTFDEPQGVRETCDCGVMCQDHGRAGNCRYLRPERAILRKLVDIVYQHATESTAVPATTTADLLIDRAYSLTRPPLLRDEGDKA